MKEAFKKLGNVTVLTETMTQTKDLAVFYAVPALAFFGFYMNSHDVEADLVPLSKYIEEFYEDGSPEQDDAPMRGAIQRLQYLPEERAKAVVKQKLVFRECDEATKMTSDQALLRLMALSKRVDVEAKASRRATKWLPKFQVLRACWPSIILLDNRIADEEATHFRCVWYVFSAATLIVKTLVIFFFAHEVCNDLVDVFEGQLTDLASLFVAAAHILLVAFLLKKEKEGLQPRKQRSPIQHRDFGE
jgi:hypothetical protein